MSKSRHWLWSGYLALAAQGGMTEAEGRQRLKTVFPNYADMVDDVIAAQGVVANMNPEFRKRSESTEEREQLALLANDANAELRGAIRQRLQGTGTPRNAHGQFSTSEQTDATDMNALIRGALGRNRMTVED